MAEKTAILVVGMHRSGTSALARTISLLGARLPTELVGPNEGNPNGHWEPQLIVELNDRMLADSGSDVYSIIDFRTDWFQSPRARDFAEKAVEILRTSFGDDPFIVIKDPRVALLLPIWHEALTKLGYRCVHVLPIRHPDAVADSLRRRHLKSIPYDGWSTPRGQAVWLRYTIAGIFGTRKTTRCFVNYANLIADWRGVADQMARELGIVWPRRGSAADREIDAFLHANEKADAQLDIVMPDPERIDDMSYSALADGLHAVLVTSGDDNSLTDKIAHTYHSRMSASADLVGAYEGLYPVVWQYYEAQLKSESRNQLANERIAGMSSAVQNLWQDLTKATSDVSVTQQDLGSQSARVESLEAALAHAGRVIAESNADRDRHFAELTQAVHRLGLKDQELAQAASLVAAIKDDKSQTSADLAHFQAESQLRKEIIESMQRSTSWRLTAPMRKMISLVKRR